MATKFRDDRPAPLGLLPAKLPLTASVAEIEVAVAEAGLLPLLMSVVHLTGRLDIVRAAGPTQKPQTSTDQSGSIPAEHATILRAQAVEAITAWRDAGCPEPYQPDQDEIAEMLDVLAGKALDPRYVPMLSEELGFGGDERAFAWDKPVGEADKQRLPVIVVGAGLSGIVMGHRLNEAGIPFIIIEKNSGPGGTWFENRFPGARVDVPSHTYSFSFVRDRRWPELFSQWTVLRRYFADCAQKLGIEPLIRYETKVVRAVWQEALQQWAVAVQTRDGSEETLHAAALVSAVGQLNRPLIPDFEGREKFNGVQVHTSNWPEDLAVAGKKVAVIGTAATALQLVPEVAREAEHLTVFQRSPTWVAVNPEYRRAILPGEQWAIDHLPGYSRWYRVLMYNWADDGSPDRMLIDPAWPQDGRSVSAANEASRVRLTEAMSREIGSDPELLDKLIPKYPPYVKRPNVGDGGFFRAFSRSNVALNTSGIARFDESGVIDGNGVHHDLDIVAFATGFRALEYLAPMEIVGRDGLRITDFWGDEPRAHLGITVPHFPNLFLMYGPGTNLGYNGNLFFNGECQARYIVNTLKWMAEDGIGAVDVKEAVYRDYAARMDEALANFTWSHGSAVSWYKNKAGKVVANSPWPLLTYWEWTREPDRAEFGTDPLRTET